MLTGSNSAWGNMMSKERMASDLLLLGNSRLEA